MRLFDTYEKQKEYAEKYPTFHQTFGLYPAYHMNKLHWISVILQDAPEDVIKFLVNVSFEATKTKNKKRAE